MLFWMWFVQVVFFMVPAAEPERGAEVVEMLAAESAGGFADADALLAALEKADAGLVSFDADIEYDRRFALQGDQHVRRGHIYYRVVPAPEGASESRGVFAVLFEQLQIEDSVREEKQSFVFDGEWFIEKNEAAKRFVKRQVALPGERINPLRLGEGPFPIPIGQKRADILARYSARLAPMNESLENEAHLNAGFLRGATQIVLSPRPEFGRDEFREIRLWYRSEGGGRLLPRLARTLNMQGDVSFVRLVGMRVNDPAFPEGIATIAEPARGEGWEVQIELKRAEAPDHGAAE